MIHVIRTLMGRKFCLLCKTSVENTWFDKHIVDHMPIWMICNPVETWIATTGIKIHQRHSGYKDGE